MSSQGIDCILVGILADKQDLAIDYSRVAFVNNNQEIQFSMKIISKTPEGINREQLVTCYANKFADFGWEDNYYEDWPIRANNFESFLRDQIILFRPTFRVYRGSTYINAEPIMILPKPKAITRDSFLIPILRLVGEQFKGYERRLLQKESFVPFRNYPWDMPIDNPIFVYIGKYLYGGFTEQARRLERWVFEHDGHLVRVACDLSAWEDIVLFEEVAFIDQVVYHQEFVTLLKNQGEPFDINAFPEATLANPVTIEEPILVNDEVELKECESQLVALSEVEKSEIISGDEAQFLEQLKRLSHAQGLYYDEDDLYNFHIALKTGGLVILAGMSGTGKSRLVRVYADALGIHSKADQTNFVFIPVRPTWADDTDLLGYLDMANHLYRTPETELVNTLIEAEKNPEKIYMICFDEMNLARVEHYFAKFISVLELPADERMLQLYNSSNATFLYNSHIYPSHVKIGTNVLFVGTVNIDETTYVFSDKVLDRSNMIKLKVIPFKSASEANIDTTLQQKITYKERFLHWVIRAGAKYSLSPHELGFFDELREAIHRADGNKGVSHRSLKQIERYLLNIPRTEQGPLIPRAKAFDFLLKQKILPIIRGSQQQLQKLVGKYNESSGDVEDSELIAILDEYSNISDFVKSREEIKQKSRELRWYGYVSQ